MPQPTKPDEKPKVDKAEIRKIDDDKKKAVKEKEIIKK